jgi:hypothetical protein
VDELEFERIAPPVDELAARIQAAYFGEEVQTIDPGKEALEEAVVIASWLRRELIDGFVMDISPGAELEEILQTLLHAVANPRAAGTCITA